MYSATEQLQRKAAEAAAAAPAPSVGAAVHAAAQAAAALPAPAPSHEVQAAVQAAAKAAAGLERKPLILVRTPDGYVKTELNCPSCGSPHESEDRFCGNCGHALKD